MSTTQIDSPALPRNATLPPVPTSDAHAAADPLSTLDHLDRLAAAGRFTPAIDPGARDRAARLARWIEGRSGRVAGASALDLLVHSRGCHAAVPGGIRRALARAADCAAREAMESAPRVAVLVDLAPPLARPLLWVPPGARPPVRGLELAALAAVVLAPVCRGRRIGVVAGRPAEIEVAETDGIEAVAAELDALSTGVSEPAAALEMLAARARGCELAVLVSDRAAWSRGVVGWDRGPGGRRLGSRPGLVVIAPSAPPGAPPAVRRGVRRLSGASEWWRRLVPSAPPAAGSGDLGSVRGGVPSRGRTKEPAALDRRRPGVVEGGDDG